jgi:hypothetical protein
LSEPVLVAAIAAGPPTLAAILGYLANSRSIKRTVGEPQGVPLITIVERLDAKVDKLADGQSSIRERIARLEGPRSLVRERGRRA